VNPIAALHTTARGYCIATAPWLDPRAAEQRYNNPDDEVDEGPDGEPTREEYWRQELMSCILPEIERKQPEDFTMLDDLQAFLATVIRDTPYQPWEERDSPNIIWKWSNVPPPDTEDIAVMDRERERFRNYVMRLSLEDLQAVEPLPYRRTLSDEEAAALWHALHVRWPSYALWFLGERELSEYEHRDMDGVFTFWWSRFAEYVPLDVLRETLRQAGARHVWQIGDDSGIPREVEVDAFVPVETEAHFCSAGLDWVMYCDHESQITVAGDLMRHLLNDVWPDWERYVNEGYATDQICPQCGAELRMTHGWKLYCSKCDA
jgi:hypothetical protein